MSAPSDPLLGGDIGGLVLRKATVGLSAREVLEVGCGRGLFVHFLKEELLPEAEFVGVDIDMDALLQFSNSLKGVSQVCGDGKCLPVRDDSVDMAICRTLLLNVSDPDAFVQEMSRVLRVGGRLVAVEADFLAQSGFSSVTGELELQRDLLMATAGKVDLSFGPKVLGILKGLPLGEVSMWCYPVLECHHAARSGKHWQECVARFRSELGSTYSSLRERAAHIDRDALEQTREGRYSFVLVFPMYVCVGTK
jgi:SAM-dependent methyltransferase